MLEKPTIEGNETSAYQKTPHTLHEDKLTLKDFRVDHLKEKKDPEKEGET